MRDWNPNTDDMRRTRENLEMAGFGSTPTDAQNIIGCGVEQGLKSGLGADEIRSTVDTALHLGQTAAGQTTGGGNSGGSMPTTR